MGVYIPVPSSTTTGIPCAVLQRSGKLVAGQGGKGGPPPSGGSDDLSEEVGGAAEGVHVEVKEAPVHRQEVLREVLHLRRGTGGDQWMGGWGMDVRPVFRWDIWRRMAPRQGGTTAPLPPSSQLCFCGKIEIIVEQKKKRQITMAKNKSRLSRYVLCWLLESLLESCFACKRRNMRAARPRGYTNEPAQRCITGRLLLRLWVYIGSESQK